MPLEVARGLLTRAGQYLRTAAAAQENGDHDAAFENARAAAELAAKAMLEHAGVPYGQDHNVAGALVQAGCRPRSRGKTLSRFLSEYVRGVYVFTKPIRAKDARAGIALARQVVDVAGARLERTG